MKGHGHQCRQPPTRPAQGPDRPGRPCTPQPKLPPCFNTWLRGLADEEKAEAEKYWLKGWILNEEYKSGRFMQDYPGQEKSERLFFKHAEELSKRKRSTLQRWMALPLVYSLARFLELVSLGACPSVLMASQCYEAGYEANLQFTLQRTLIADFSRAGEAEANSEDAEKERLRQLRLLQESEMIVLGDDEVSKRHVKLGLTLDGRLLAMTLYRPLFWLLVGSQGFGKTHLGVLISEGALLDLVGINELDGRRSRVWTFSAEWRRQNGNHQLLCGRRRDQEDLSRRGVSPTARRGLRCAEG